MALKDVILGYAKGAKGDKGDTGEKGDQGDIGPKGDPGNIADAEITDTYGLLATEGQKLTAQKLFDAIANKITNVLVSNDALTQKLADYMLKSLMSNVNLNSTENVPTSALVYTMQESLNALNSSLSNISNRFYAQTSETDFNKLTKSGYYYGKLTQNTPDGTTDTNWIVEVQAFDDNPNYVFQRVARASDKSIFTRIKDNRTWSDWEVLARKSDFTYVDIDMSSATVNTDFSVSYPSGFNRNNSVVIGVAGYNKKYGAWYGYLNNSDIHVTLATNIIVQTASDLFAGEGAKLRVMLMRV